MLQHGEPEKRFKAQTVSTVLHRHLRKLPRSFYLRHTLIVAKELLGKYIVRRLPKNTLVGKIVEVEAYLGEKDPASHAYRGKTKRNEVMFLNGGHLYVYFTYGMHFCSNVVTEARGIGRAILLRAVEPVQEIEVMRKNRQFTADVRQRRMRLWRKMDFWDLTNGPAKFCQAFGIQREQNGTDLLGNKIFITQGEKIPKSQIRTSTRIGINNGKEKKWRFYVNNNPFVSNKKPS